MVLGKNVKSSDSDTLEAPLPEKKESKKSSSNGHDLPKEVENKLEELDLKNEVLNASCLISMTDKKGFITFVNDKFCEVAKYSRDELIGQNHNIVRHPDMPKSLFKDLWATIGKGKMFNGFIKNRAKDGTHYWVDAYIAPILGKDGKPESYIGIRYDITAERDERERNIQVLEQAVDSVITIDTDKKVTFFNKAAEAMFGYSKDEVIGQNVKMIVPQEHKANHDNYVNNNLNTGVNKVIGTGRDLEMTRKDGSRFWGNLSLSKVDTGNGVQYTAFIKDITKERFERERNIQVLEQAVDSVVTINADKIVTFYNRAAEKMFGFKREEVIGQNVKMIVPMEHRANHDNYVDSNIKTGINKVIGTGRDLEMTRKDGSMFWGNLALSKVEVDGNIQYTAFIKDITDQKSIINQVNEIIKQTSEEGDLSNRINTDNASGDFEILANGINRLLDTLSEPIYNFKDAVEALAGGDLTKKVVVESKGDVKAMMDGYNSAIDNMKNLMSSINDLATLVASSSEEMLSKSEQMKGSTGEMSSAVREMAEGAQDQAQQIDQASKLIEKILQTAQETAKKAQSINKTAEEGRNSSKEGVVTINSVVSSMEEIQKSAKITSESIEVLTQRSEEIARTLNVITDIASQTNLLALNAAIEAARAGDAGRGFAVVAEEIRKLAEDSRNSAHEIEKVINEVQKDVGSASKAIQGMETSVITGNKASKDAEGVFKSIDSSSEQTFLLSSDIMEATKEQETSVNNTVKNIEKIVVVSEETASGTEQIAASSTDLSDGMDEVSATSRDLADVANQLLEGVSKFKL